MNNIRQQYSERTDPAYLLVLISRQNLVDPLLPQQIVLQVIGVLVATGCGGRIHPVQLFLSLLAGLLFLHPLQLLWLPLLLLLLAELIKLLLLLELCTRKLISIALKKEDNDKTYRFLLLEPDPLLILQQERVPGLLHIQVSTTHLD